MLNSEATLSIRSVSYFAAVSVKQGKKKGEACKQTGQRLHCVRDNGGFHLSVMFGAFKLSSGHARSDELLFARPLT